MKFGLEIEESLPYAAMAQATYSPPAATPGYDLMDMAKAITRELHRAPSLLSFLASKQKKTLVTLQEAVRHPAASLLH